MSGSFSPLAYPAGNEGGSPGNGWDGYPAMLNPQMLPTYYQYNNRIISQYHPSVVNVTNTGLFNYFCKYLLQKLISVLKWEIPEHWNMDFFLYTLYVEGRVCILETDKFGVIPQRCGFGGVTVFYRPAYAIVANPAFGDKSYYLEIGTECSVLQLQNNFEGVLDIIGYYASLMAVTAQSIGTNIFNSKLAYLFLAKNKNVAESMKKTFDRISAGEPATVVDSSLFNEDGTPNYAVFNQNLNQTYIADKLLSDLRKIESMFATDIGLPNANTDKRERLITSEVNANNVETASKVEFWLDHLRKGCEDARQLFGIDISVDWRYNPMETGDNIGDKSNETNSNN